jgi:3-oxoacyl-[acyl-carrier-protein] synthase II
VTGNAGQARTVMVVGHAVHVPGRPAAGPAGSPAAPACTAESAHEVLGRKGLLGKDPATRLALCATHRMLGLPPGRPVRPLPGAARTAVVVSSNLGNVAAVCSVVDEVRARSVRTVSALDAPNASSNVIASTIAIWYGFTGPNVMVCNGATSGLDAVQVASRLLRAGRAARAVVVGVEPPDGVASRFAATVEAHPHLAGGAAALLLEPRSMAAAGVILCPVIHHATPEVPGPEGLSPGAPLSWPPVGTGLNGRGDLLARADDMYGADGVLRVAVAAAVLGGPEARTPSSLLVTCGDRYDGYASAWLGRPAPPAGLPGADGRTISGPDGR